VRQSIICQCYKLIFDVRLGFKIGAAPASPVRQKAALGETVGINVQTNPAPDGAKEFSAGGFLPPHPGLEIFLNDQPTVSPSATFVRHSVAENRSVTR
jgi:hypothetical protein